LPPLYSLDIRGAAVWPLLKYITEWDPNHLDCIAIREEDGKIDTTLRSVPTAHMKLLHITSLTLHPITTFLDVCPGLEVLHLTVPDTWPKPSQSHFPRLRVVSLSLGAFWAASTSGHLLRASFEALSDRAAFPAIAHIRCGPCASVLTDDTWWGEMADKLQSLQIRAENSDGSILTSLRYHLDLLRDTAAT
jgi:hypothetical protein